MSSTRKFQSRQTFSVQQGATFAVSLLWSQPHFVVKPITAISKSCRAEVDSAAHGIPAVQTWPVYIRGVQGMTEINHAAEDLDNVVEDKAYLALVLTADKFQLDVDTLDMQEYSQGGQIAYRPPVDLTGCTARMQIRKSAKDATALLTISSVTPTDTGSLLILGGVTGAIDIDISAEDTAAFTFADAVFDVEITHADGETITRVAEGTLKLSLEVTKDS